MTHKPRFTEPRIHELAERQQAIYKRVESGPRGRVPINIRLWLENPDFVDAVEPFGLYVSGLAPITKRQKELVVLVGARFWDAAYEWNMHVQHATKAGFTATDIADIAAGRIPQSLDDLERATYLLVTRLHSKGPVDEETHANAMRVLGHRGVTDIIGLVGLYTMIAMSLNFFDIPAPTA